MYLILFGITLSENLESEHFAKSTQEIIKCIFIHK